MLEFIWLGIKWLFTDGIVGICKLLFYYFTDWRLFLSLNTLVLLPVGMIGGIASSVHSNWNSRFLIMFFVGLASFILALFLGLIGVL